MKRSILGAVSVLTASAFALSACGAGSSAKSEGTINIGVLTACTGVFAVACDPIKDGVNFWLDEHDGRLGGREVALSVADEKSTTEGVVSATNDLIRRHEVDAIVGLVDSAGALAVRPTLMRNKVITIDTLASPPGLLDPDKAPYLFMVTAPPEATAAAAAVLAETQGWDGVVGLADNFVGSRAWADPLLDAMEKSGITVKSRIYPSFPTSDYAPHLTKISNSKAGVVVPVMFGASATSMFQSYRAMGLKTPIYTTGSMLEPTSVSDDLMELARGSYAYWNYSPSLQSPENKAFVDGFKAKYDRTPGGFEMQAYLGMEFLDKAYAKAGEGASPDQVRQALQEVKVASPVGEVSLGTGQAVNWNLYLTKVEVGPHGQAALVPVGPYIEGGVRLGMTLDEARAALANLPEG